MGLFHLAELFGMTIRESANDGSDFTNPSADYRRLFLGEDGQLHVKDSAGAVTDIGGAVADILDLPTAETDTALRLAPDGAGGVEWGTGGGVDPAGFTAIVSSADEDATNVSGATQDHTELQFATVAGKHYMIDLFLMIGGSDATGDFAFRFAVTAGTMSGRSTLTINDASLAAALSSFAASAAATSGSVTIGTPADVTFPTAVRLSYAVLVSNTTTFKLQFGNASAGVGRISRVFKGSVMRWKQTD